MVRAMSVAVAVSAVGVLGCGMPKNSLNLHQRSMQVVNVSAEQSVMARASISFVGSEQNVRLLRLQGTPYEMGFQHGVLLQKEIDAFYRSLMWRLQFIVKEETLDEIYDLMDPYIPQEEKEEMRGLAHGAGVPLRVVHWVHSIPEAVEYGEKSRFRRFWKETSCSNIAAFGSATPNGALYHLRVLDWIRELAVKSPPTILVHVPNEGNASVTFSYAGFIGCISGMNDQQMSFGEMGYGNPPGESLEGTPFIFLFRKLMRESNTLSDAIAMIERTRRTCSYIYLITDAKGATPNDKAALIITDRGRVKVIYENTYLHDERDNDPYPAVPRVVYGGAKSEALYGALTRDLGAITPDRLKEITKEVALNSNVQNVIFAPATLEAWVSNAKGVKDQAGRACNQPWFYVSFAELFKR